MHSLPILIRLVLVALFLVPLSCGGSNKPKVAFVTNNTHEYWNLVKKGFYDELKKHDNVEGIFQQPPEGTAAGQKKIIDAMVAKGVKAISVSVNDPENQTEYLDSVASKVPLLAVDNDAEESHRRCYIGTDNVKAGRTVGKLVKEAMPEGGKIALFVGLIDSLNARQRVQGVLEELGIPTEKLGFASTLQSKDGKYELVRKETYTDDTKQNIARENASVALSKNPGDNFCLVGLWAYNPPAILQAAKDAKRAGKVKIIGFDENYETLQGIEDGSIYATVVQNPYLFGKRAAEVMALIASGEDPKFPANGKEIVAERIVTKDGGKDRLKASVFKEELENLKKD